MAGKSLKGTKSHENLKEAFARESQANRRYLYFARVADIEGFPDMAGLFKDTADAETGQDRKSTRLNSSHRCISYAVFCLKKKKKKTNTNQKHLRITMSQH